MAIWLATGLGVFFVLLHDFEQLADTFIPAIWPFYALAVASVFVLRRNRPDMERPYRAWGYPVVPALFLLASVRMVVNALATDPRIPRLRWGSFWWACRSTMYGVRSAGGR